MKDKDPNKQEKKKKPSESIDYSGSRRKLKGKTFTFLERWEDFAWVAQVWDDFKQQNQKEL